MYVKGYCVTFIGDGNSKEQFFVSSILDAIELIFDSNKSPIHKKGYNFASISEDRFIVEFSDEQIRDVKDNYNGDYVAYLNSKVDFNKQFSFYVINNKVLLDVYVNDGKIEVRKIDEDEVIINKP